jgi:uncharacterized integral membrane protein (TIGR00697 family)
MEQSPALKPATYQRDLLFLFLSGIFLTALVLGNVIGTTKFVTVASFDLPSWMLWIPEFLRKGVRYEMNVPVGVLAYPFTFLATDLISELFGRKKAQAVVWTGLAMNGFMLLLMVTGAWLPDAGGVSGGTSLFDGVFRFMIANTTASMIAYFVAQTIDVRLFHFWKKLTHGRHLWLRNNGSTMVSQLVDSTTILTILFITGSLGADVTTLSHLALLILNSYVFKFCFALLDTPFFYLGVHYLKSFQEDPEKY